jgi:hypothetical protein
MMQIITPPIRLKNCIAGLRLEFRVKGIIRITPYPPSFNRMAAKIIDPNTGASTWALGSHKCSEYIGSLAMKAIVRNMNFSSFFIVLIDSVFNMRFEEV